MKVIFIIGILLITFVSCSKNKEEIARENIKQYISDKAFKENIRNVDFIVLDVVEMQKISVRILEYNKQVEPIIQELKELNASATEKNKEMERLGEGVSMFNVAARKIELEDMKEDQDRAFTQMQNLHSKADSIKKALDAKVFDSIYESKVFMKAIFTYNDGHKENMMDTVYPIHLNKEYQVIQKK